MDYSDKKSGYRIGQILWKGSYKDDKKNGEWIFYKPNEKIKKIEIYKDGKLIRK